jgi:CheY-like chemotaxis protein
MGSTILFVEDHDDLRATTAAVLSTLGYDVIEARNGAEALNLLAGGVHVDILLTDLMMPEMSGFQLAVEVRRLQPFFKVIFVTGYDLDPRLNGETVVKKPFTMGQLSGAIVRALAA